MKKFILRIKYSGMSLFDLFSDGLCRPTEGSIGKWIMEAEMAGTATEKTISRWYKELTYMKRGLYDDKAFDDMLNTAKAHIKQ